MITMERQRTKSTKALLFFFILTAVLISSSAQARDISFTQDDRDRIIRLDEGQKALQRQIDETQKSLQRQMDDGQKSLQRQFDDGQKSLQRQMDDLKTFMLWGFGILFGGMGFLLGFVMWDRRTALAPAIRKAQELEEREARIERALKELAAKDHKVAEALKHAGIL